MPNRKDVIVVGAGLAGLTCARELCAAGLDVVVLEESDGIGGRMRTDIVDDFQIDRGFQLINPGYPQLRAVADVHALDIRTFDPALSVLTATGRREVRDPRRPSGALRTIVGGRIGPRDLATWMAWSLSLRSAPEGQTLGESLDAAGVRGTVRDSIVVPFLTGVTADDPETLPAVWIRQLLRWFARSTPGVPSRGMQELPNQLVRGLDVRLGTTVIDVTPVGGRPGGVEVTTLDARLMGRAVVVAVDGPSAGALLGSRHGSEARSLTTWWWATRELPEVACELAIDATRSGPLVNASVMSQHAPSYAPAGQHLVQGTALSSAEEPLVRAQAGRMLGASTRDWQLLRRSDVTAALPSMVGRDPSSARVNLGEGLFVCGDHVLNASIDGAMGSGRRAAAGVREWLGVARPRRR